MAYEHITRVDSSTPAASAKKRLAGRDRKADRALIVETDPRPSETTASGHHFANARVHPKDEQGGAVAISTNGGGRALPEGVRSKMERALGHDFSSIRVHEAATVAEAGARAFTRGSDVIFAPGEYQPASAAGQRVLGHELVHATQQSDGRVGPKNGNSSIVDDDGLEAEATRLGDRAARGAASGPGKLVPLSEPPMPEADAALQPLWKKNEEGKWEEVKEPADGEALPLRSTPKHDKYQGEDKRVGWRAWVVDGGYKSPEKHSFSEQIRRSAWARKKTYVTKYDDDPSTSEAPIVEDDGRHELDLPIDVQEKHWNRQRTFGFVQRPRTGNLHLFDPDTPAHEPGTTINPHHTTPSAGKPVAGAGMIGLDDDRQVEWLSDQSGHYTPRAEFTHQTVSTLHTPERSVFAGGEDIYRKQVRLTGYDAIRGAGKSWVRDTQGIEKGSVTLPADAFVQTQGNELQIRRKIALNAQIRTQARTYSQRHGDAMNSLHQWVGAGEFGTRPDAPPVEADHPPVDLHEPDQTQELLYTNIQAYGDADVGGGLYPKQARYGDAALDIAGADAEFDDEDSTDESDTYGAPFDDDTSDDESESELVDEPDRRRRRVIEPW